VGRDGPLMLGETRWSQLGGAQGVVSYQLPTVAMRLRRPSQTDREIDGRAIPPSSQRRAARRRRSAAAAAAMRRPALPRPLVPLVSLVAIVGSVALVALFALVFATPPTAAAPSAGGAALRAELLRLFDAQRAAAGVATLRHSAALERVAQQNADEMAAADSISASRMPQDAMQQRLAAAGYEARQWVESLLSLPPPASAAAVVEGWREGDADATYLRLIDKTFADVGVGVAASRPSGAASSGRGGQVYVSIFFAVSQSEAFERDTAGLHDLARIRAELQAQINRQRQQASVPPLTLNSQLDVAAQRHAEDMLARSYFAHRSPEGATVRERATAAGYIWRTIGENLAEGQPTIADAVDGWMHSQGHRENILNPSFVDTGIGLAIGRDPHTGGYRILWVQTFGRRR
jgi:uncharacterized protein YkwD